MPQPKLHVSAAARQAAYRKRTEKARRAVLASKGLPALPAIPTMPGCSRWNASIAVAYELISTTLGEMQNYLDDRSERWQESDRADEHRDRINSVEAAMDALAELSF
jgi:hypothetical protein